MPIFVAYQRFYAEALSPLGRIIQGLVTFSQDFLIRWMSSSNIDSVGVNDN
jgi:hypothetical protein